MGNQVILYGIFSGEYVREHQGDKKSDIKAIPRIVSYLHGELVMSIPTGQGDIVLYSAKTAAADEDDLLWYLTPSHNDDCSVQWDEIKRWLCNVQENRGKKPLPVG